MFRIGHLFQTLIFVVVINRKFCFKLFPQGACQNSNSFSSFSQFNLLIVISCLNQILQFVRLVSRLVLIIIQQRSAREGVYSSYPHPLCRRPHANYMHRNVKVQVCSIGPAERPQPHPLGDFCSIFFKATTQQSCHKSHAVVKLTTYDC